MKWYLSSRTYGILLAALLILLLVVVIARDTSARRYTADEFLAMVARMESASDTPAYREKMAECSEMREHLDRYNVCMEDIGFNRVDGAVCRVWPVPDEVEVPPLTAEQELRNAERLAAAAELRCEEARQLRELPWSMLPHLDSDR